MPSKVQPALLGGALMGVLSALPVVNLGNCCCLWIIGGGVMAAYIMQANHPRPITSGDGALVGLLAGFVGAAVWLALTIPIDLMMGPVQRRIVERLLENAQDVPGPMRDMLDTMSREGATTVRLVLRFCSMLFIGSIFSTLGGLLGAVMFRKQPPTSEAGIVQAPPPTE